MPGLRLRRRLPSVRAVTFQVSALRRPGALAHIYDWHVGGGLHDGRPPALVLRHHERAHWPRLVREFGISTVDVVSFTVVEDRMLFALDCDL